MLFHLVTDMIAQPPPSPVSPRTRLSLDLLAITFPPSYHSVLLFSTGSGPGFRCRNLHGFIRLSAIFTADIAYLFADAVFVSGATQHATYRGTQPGAPAQVPDAIDQPKRAARVPALSSQW